MRLSEPSIIFALMTPFTLAMLIDSILKDNFSWFVFIYFISGLISIFYVIQNLKKEKKDKLIWSEIKQEIGFI